MENASGASGIKETGVVKNPQLVRLGEKENATRKKFLPSHPHRYD